MFLVVAFPVQLLIREDVNQNTLISQKLTNEQIPASSLSSDIAAGL